MKRSHLALVGLFLGGMTAAAGAAAWQLAHVGHHEGYAPRQPIAFSHKIHAGDAKVPCLYCHFGARTSRHAGIPPTGVCMNCHDLLGKSTLDVQKLRDLVQQDRSLEWVKVHNLPDFVYFNHSQHVFAAVSCRECHGAVESMERVVQKAPLTMGWCLDCHRRNGARAAGTVHAASAAVRDRAPSPGLDCGKCHY